MPYTVSSRVQLTLLSLFRQHGKQAQPVVGAERVYDEGRGLQVVASSIPFHNRALDSKAPRSGMGLLALFGIRDALDELQHWRKVARSSQAQFAYLQLQIEVGMNSTVAPTRQILREQGAGMRFLNVRRSSAELQRELLARFAEYVAQEGGKPERDMHHVRHMAQRPDLFERLLHEDEDLRHIDVLVMPLADWPDPARMRQVAYLRAGTPLLTVLQGSDQMQVHLPDWMAQRHVLETVTPAERG